MDAATEVATLSLPDLRSCSPAEPWHAPTRGFGPPLPDGGVAAYNPQVHEAVGGEGRLVLGYDVDRLDADAASAPANITRNVSLYRPRFVSLRLAPG